MFTCLIFQIQLCTALYWRPPEIQSTGSTSPALVVSNSCHTTDTNLNRDRTACMHRLLLNAKTLKIIDLFGLNMTSLGGHETTKCF